LGIVLALNFVVGLVCCAAWAVGAGLSRMSSMGALCAASISTFAVVAFGNGPIMLLCMLLTVLVFWRHRANISRIKAGTEPKIGQKS
jgi:glycerol-3-phosphate acyltransferase PlsY